MNTGVRRLTDNLGLFTAPLTTQSAEGPEGLVFAAYENGERITDLMSLPQLRSWMDILGLTF